MTTGEDLNALYGTMISPSARVAIPDAWLPAIHVAMQEFVDLPTEIRAFVIVVDRNEELMESLMSGVIVRAHPEMFMSPPLVEIGGGWLGVAEKLIKDLKALHPGLRVGAMFRDGQGMMHVDVAFEAGDYGSDILDRVLEITSQARLLSAWACHVDGRPGWLVDAPDGRRPLCPDCQRKRGLKGVRHAA